VVEVVVVSGDNDEDGFKNTTNGFPWVAIPFDGEDRKGPIGAKVPCTGYPTPGVVNAKTGKVINADAFDEMGQGMGNGAALLEGWLAQLD
jgi:hypothetical protein